MLGIAFSEMPDGGEQAAARTGMLVPANVGDIYRPARDVALEVVPRETGEVQRRRRLVVEVEVTIQMDEPARDSTEDQQERHRDEHALVLHGVAATWADRVSEVDCLSAGTPPLPIAAL